MNSIWICFKESLTLPKKKSVFALNRIGMDMIVIYMFILIFLSSIPKYIEQLDKNTDLSNFFFSIFFFIFYYLPLVVIIFIFISFLAWISGLIAKALKRKLKFAILWKMIASATTIPFILFTLISFFYTLPMYYLFLSLIFIFYIMTKIILIYPKRRSG